MYPQESQHHPVLCVEVLVLDITDVDKLLRRADSRAFPAGWVPSLLVLQHQKKNAATHKGDGKHDDWE